MHVYKKNKNNAQKGSHYHIGGENLLSPKMQNIQSIEKEISLYACLDDIKFNPTL